ncbi:MAG: alpha/beta hydrolase [Treponema sp.]|nr:alpha/beta hydrolase [Treponema sp.]MCL2250538.1 alpha/beta hydrolase [Treponema sp.]
MKINLKVLAKVAVNIFICLLILSSCKSTNNIQIKYFTDYVKYFETEVSPVKGIVITAHGLNTNPSKMGDDNTDGTLVKLFLKEGYNVYRIVLPGHGGTIEEMQNINANDWLNSAYLQYQEAAEIARKNNLPIYLAAFSLGALVYTNLIHNNDVIFSKIILFAPAIAIKGIARTGIFTADIFLSDKSIIKSIAPIEYQAQKGVSISAYKALFELENNLYKSEFANCNIPALIFINPKDELINISKLRKIISNFNLSNWNIETVTNTKTEFASAEITPTYHHLIIDDKCVSPAAWNIIREKIINFLE